MLLLVGGRVRASFPKSAAFTPSLSSSTLAASVWQGRPQASEPKALALNPERQATGMSLILFDDGGRVNQSVVEPSRSKKRHRGRCRYKECRVAVLGDQMLRLDAIHSCKFIVGAVCSPQSRDVIMLTEKTHSYRSLRTMLCSKLCLNSCVLGSRIVWPMEPSAMSNDQMKSPWARTRADKRTFWSAAACLRRLFRLHGCG